MWVEELQLHVVRHISRLVGSRAGTGCVWGVGGWRDGGGGTETNRVRWHVKTKFQSSLRGVRCPSWADFQSSLRQQLYVYFQSSLRRFVGHFA